LDISFLGSLYQGEGFFLEGEDPISAAYGTCTNSICSTIDTAAVTPGPGDGGGALVTTDPGAYTGPGANTGITPVPEPSSLSMLVLSFVGLAGGFFFKARQNGLLLKT
jgi:hypothetical protein